jgi:hypothetical protein
MAFETIRKRYDGPSPVQTIAELRALNVSAVEDGDAVLVVDERVVVRWSALAVGPEIAGGACVKPNSKTDTEPGRWYYSEELPYPVSPWMIRVLVLSADNSGSAWPSALTSLRAGTLVVPNYLKEGTAIARLTLTGKFTTAGTMQAGIRLDVDATDGVMELGLESESLGTTLFTSRVEKLPLTPGTKALDLKGQAGASFVGVAQLEAQLYSIKL